MRTKEEIYEMVLSYVKNDPLYKVIKDTPQEEILFNDEYLATIIEKTGYPMADIVEWFNSSDGQLRYYIRPFFNYIFEENGVVSGNTNNVLRLNIRQILRLRMLTLLKEEYRVKGLKQLLGLDGEGYVEHTREFPQNDKDVEMGNIQEELEQLREAVKGIINTGLFKVSEDGIKINEGIMSEKIRLIFEGSPENLRLVENVTQLEKAHQDLQEIESEIKVKKDELAILEEKTKENLTHAERALQEFNTIQTLRLEALNKWKEQSKYGVWAKLTKSDQIEVERERFVQEYIEKNLKSTN